MISLCLHSPASRTPVGDWIDVQEDRGPLRAFRHASRPMGIDSRLTASLGGSVAMPISAKRTIIPEKVRNFGRFGDATKVPPLCDIQVRSYERFLQLDTPPEKRTATGLEGVLREIFPIESYDKTLSLDYLKYELGKPRYEPDECRQLRLTFGRPFRVWLRLNKEQPVEEEVYLGDMPIMIGG